MSIFDDGTGKNNVPSNYWNALLTMIPVPIISLYLSIYSMIPQEELDKYKFFVLIVVLVLTNLYQYLMIKKKENEIKLGKIWGELVTVSISFILYALTVSEIYFPPILNRTFYGILIIIWTFAVPILVDIKKK